MKKIVRANESRLLGIVSSLVKDSVEAQDLVQDTFLELIEGADINLAIENVSAWLVAVAKNKVIDRFRRKRTQSDYAKSAENEAGSLLLMAAQNDPEATSWNSELREVLLQAVLELPQEQQEVFIQHEFEGKSFEEISKASGVGINTLLARKRYAIQFLRESLREVYDELE